MKEEGEEGVGGIKRKISPSHISPYANKIHIRIQFPHHSTQRG